jgi:hypothetical protein
MYPKHDELTLEDIKPFSNVTFELVEITDFLKNPIDYLLLKTKTDIITLYTLTQNPEELRIKLERHFHKPVAVGSPILFEHFVEISFAIQSDTEFALLLDKLRIGANKTEDNYKMLTECLKLSSQKLDKAEQLINDAESSKGCGGRQMISMLRYINDSAVCFVFANSLLPSGYGLAIAKKMFDKLNYKQYNFDELATMIENNPEELAKLEKFTKDNDKNFYISLMEFVCFYDSLLTIQMLSSELDPHKRRSTLWHRAAAIFKDRTGRDVSEFVDQYGSGYKVEEFLKQLD